VIVPAPKASSSTGTQRKKQEKPAQTETEQPVAVTRPVAVPQPAATAEKLVEAAPAAGSGTETGGQKPSGKSEQPMMVFDLQQHPDDVLYQPDRYKIITLRWLAALLCCIALLSASPAVPYYSLAGAPSWAILVLVIAALQIIYIAWMVTLPDWSSVRVLMLVFAFSAAVYGCALAMVLVAEPTPDMPLHLYSVHRLAMPWCAAMVLLAFLGSYLCGRFSHGWYRGYARALQAAQRT
jgi:hypothetical protein